MDPIEKRKKVDCLTQACADAIKMYPPKDGETFCNHGVHLISSRMGFKGFADLLANQIVDRMTNAPEFAVVSAAAAQALANEGNLVIAGVKGDPQANGQLGHGHVTVCYPGSTIYSGKWRDDCPMVCNVGKENKICGANYAFVASKPRYFAWISGKVS